MTTFINRNINFTDFCMMEEIVFFLNKEIFELEDLVLIFKKPNATNKENAVVLCINNGTIIKCFMHLEFILSNYRIDCTKPILERDENFKIITKELESSNTMAEIHWVKNKCNIKLADYFDEKSYKDTVEKFDMNN